MMTEQLPSYEELEQATEQAYLEGLKTVSCAPPEGCMSVEVPLAPRPPSNLGEYDMLLAV